MVDVTLRKWSEHDLNLLVRGNAPSMTEHLGGPESDEEVVVRHNNYLRFWTEGSARMYVINADGQPAGAIGWWTTRWRGADVYETGWFVLPEEQGRGIARAAVALLINDAVQHGTLPTLTAYPSTANAASNALCATSGFTNEGVEPISFRGVDFNVNAWALDLRRRPHTT